ncbi:PREDICTED: nucleolar transcription factor 1-like [Cyprinodon variegatus]|uniref:nucleolar transcription factor 1-like n=1 Tax=Cyprinodon variegatus TaxID=28743 RepID=UPI000742B83D|nr:PREDICTED: nucleolar transcription factor 1-like [Cyprinodon variegatus]
MNGSSSVSAAQSVRIKAEADEWTKDDCLTLLERIRSLLPDGDAMKYKTTESHFDWDKVRFGSFTGDMCRQKWLKVSSEVRKYRTMTELLVDAMELVKNPYKGKKLKTHPDFPKKPLTPYFRFFMEKRAKYAKIHPEMSNLDLTKILSKKYKELPEKKKVWTGTRTHLLQVPGFNGLLQIPGSDPLLQVPGSNGPSSSRNGYSLYCAELMVNMKDVPSTERMVLCSKQWKMLTQKEKDMFQKRCEQKKKQYDIDLQRFLESLPEEERERVLSEEKMGGSKLNVSQHRAKSPSLKERSREPELETWIPAGSPKDRRDGKKTVKLPETPKTAEEMWQHSVIGDYMAKYRSDRRKAQAAMDAAWRSMEKKEKIPWIKKAAEDQKRYEVQYQSVRELLEMRTPAAGQRKPKFDGEPKKPPVSGYQMFSQELLTNGELNHFSLKERMVEIGKRWQKLSQSQKDKYKKLVEEQQVEYKVELEAWVKSLSPQDRAIYKEFSSSKRRSTTKATSSPVAKVHVTAKGKAGGSRAVNPGVGVGRRAMAYRAKKDMSDSDEEEEKSNSSDSDEDDETSGSTDSEDEDENDDEEEDDDDQSSSEESSELDSD